MAVDLSDYEEALQRSVTPLGSAPVTGVDWTAYLTDAFWEARLDGFMPNWTVDENGLVTPVSGSEELPLQYTAMVVLYAGIRILRVQILNTRTGFRAKAGPVEFEQQASATMLAEMLKQLQNTKTWLLEQVRYIQGITTVEVLDALSTRMFSQQAYYGGLELTEAPDAASYRYPSFGA